MLMQGKNGNTFLQGHYLAVELYFSFSKKIESARKYKYVIIIYRKGDEFL